MSPRFSIIIPVFNVEKYLEECLQSLLNQTFKDFEVLCVENASTDNSREILADFSKKYSRIIPFYMDENLGPAKARNMAIKEAKGEILCFLDSDDYVKEDYFASINQAFLENDTDIVEFDFEQFREKDSTTIKNPRFVTLKNIFSLDFKHKSSYLFNECKDIGLEVLGFYSVRRAYKKNFILNNEIFYQENARISEDVIFEVKCNLLAQKKIVVINKPLYIYRIRQGSLSSDVTGKNLDIFKVSDNVENFLKEHNLFNEYEKAFNSFKLKEFCTYISNVNNDNLLTYQKEAQKRLSPKDYKELIRYYHGRHGILNNILSLRNIRHEGKRTKVLTILGLQIKLYEKKN